ncbi:MAG: DivIVA domain-containing protein [Nitrospinota bacterium]
MKTSPQDVRQQQFKLKFRGFDIEEVDNYLELIAVELEELNKENDSLKSEIKKMAQEIEEYKKAENDFRRMISSAQDFRKDAIEKANQESQLIIKQAEMKAAETLKGAEEKTAKIEKDIDGLKAQKRQFEVLLRALIENHMKLLDMMGEGTETEKTKTD